MTESAVPSAPTASDESMNPVGFEFWIGQLLMAGGVVIGIWLAAQTGFAEAIRFSKHENYRQARAALNALRLELELNLKDIKTANENLKENKPATVQLRTSYADAASSRPYMALVDPRLITEILKLHRFPLQEATQALLAPRLQPDMIKKIMAIFDEVVAHAEKDIFPLLTQEEKRLDAILSGYGVRQ